MTNHDPLCPMKRMEGADPRISTTRKCECDLIARVVERERDERDLLYETGLADGRLLESEKAQREAHAYIGAHRDEWIEDGYATALRDAVEAVNGLPVRQLEFWDVVARDHAVAAIEALGGER